MNFKCGYFLLSFRKKQFLPSYEAMCTFLNDKIYEHQYLLNDRIYCTFLTSVLTK